MLLSNADNNNGQAHFIMSSTDPLAELLVACAQGDQKALETLYRKVSGRLFAVSLALLRQQEMAEDVLQDSFVKIWDKAASFDPVRGKAMTWMISIVRNRALDLLRSTRVQTDRTMDEYSDDIFASEINDPLSATELGAANQAVMNCLDQLRDEQKRCIVMSYCYGHTHDELSTLLSTPLGTVKAWIRRGMEQLRECLD